MKIPLPIPPELPVDTALELEDIEDAALALYQKLSDTTRAAEEDKRRTQQELTEQADKFRSLVAALAAERFEFERLARRMAPDLVRLDATELQRALNLFQRAWDQTLRRFNVEVCDLSRCPLTDDLAEDIEVEGHVPDPAVTQTIIRETLSPLVRLEGKTIALARVITSVTVKEDSPQ